MPLSCCGYAQFTGPGTNGYLLIRRLILPQKALAIGLGAARNSRAEKELAVMSPIVEHQRNSVHLSGPVRKTHDLVASHRTVCDLKNAFAKVFQQRRGL